MIPQRSVTNGVLAALRGTGVNVGDGIAPADAGQQYAVLEPSSPQPDGTVFAPERTVRFQYRVRSVGSDAPDQQRTNPRMDAEAVADRLRARLLDRSQAISGTGWRVIGRQLLGSGTTTEGTTTNVVDDVELWVVPVA